MQIKKIILYGKNGKTRTIELALGKLNIISGKSKTGKSIIGDIIDYCFGSSSCNIAIGVVRETTDWFGLLLEHEGELLFVARKNPPIGQTSTEKCCYQFGVTDAPENFDLTAPVDLTGLVALLSMKIGISENLYTPQEAKFRQPISANIRHAMFYCIQGQDEIASQRTLFHKQSEPFVPQAIKDTLPYFLGIVNEYTLELSEERTQLKRECKTIEKYINEVKQLQGKGLERAIALIEEARGAGLISDSKIIDLYDYNSVRSALLDACQWNPLEEYNELNDRIISIQSDIEVDRIALENCEIKIQNAIDFLNHNNGYSSEINHQINRLQSIGLFDFSNFQINNCPLCSSELEGTSSCIDDIQNAVKRLSDNLSSAVREQPQINTYIETLQKEKYEIKDRIRINKIRVEALCTENVSDTFKEDNYRRARIIGRISLWIDSVIINDDVLQKQVLLENKKKRIEKIDDLLDEDCIEEHKQSIINRLSVEMTKWAKELQLEHSDFPYRLDMNKLTVIVDKERPVPLQQLGSGSNWLGCHLISLFALHKFFIEKKRPVPKIIFIDQPSQVYFPPEMNDYNVDTEEIRLIYRFLHKRVQELESNIQVIVVDHADIKEEYFQNAIIEKWWKNDQALIPTSWIESIC